MHGTACPPTWLPSHLPGSKLEDLDMWMAERFLPHGLKEKVRRYYVEVWAQHTGGREWGWVGGWGGWVHGG